MESLECTLKDLKNNDCLMGDVIVIFAGCLQILLVVPRRTKSDEINVYLKSSH